jgi:hypothetical protein
VCPRVLASSRQSQSKRKPRVIPLKQLYDSKLCDPPIRDPRPSARERQLVPGRKKRAKAAIQPRRRKSPVRTKERVKRDKEYTRREEASERARERGSHLRSSVRLWRLLSAAAGGPSINKTLKERVSESPSHERASERERERERESERERGQGEGETEA